VFILEEFETPHENGVIKGVFDSQEKAEDARNKIKGESDGFVIYEIPVNEIVNVNRYIHRSGDIIIRLE
jgi:hypothetical protein